MLTQEEARTLYAAFLEDLRQAGVSGLVRDIELTVIRGVLRSGHEFGGEKGEYQAPMSPKEALAVAIRMFLAALDPVFQIRDVQKALVDGSADQALPEVKLAFDRVEPTTEHSLDEVLRVDPGVLGEPQPFPVVADDDYSRLLEAAQRLATLVTEVEQE